MLESLLLKIRFGLLMASRLVRIQADVLGVSAWQAGLWVNDRLSTLSGLDKLGILLLEDEEVLLCFPSPDAVRSKDEVHLFKCALIGLGIETVHHGYCDDLAVSTLVIAHVAAET